MTLDPEEERLAAYRNLRDEALALVKDDIEALKLDLELRGLGARLADRAGHEVHAVWEQAIEVAAAHRALVAGTVLALVAWLLRGPIARGFSALFGGGGDAADESELAAANRQRQEQGEPT